MTAHVPLRPCLPSDGLAHLSPADRQVLALEDHLARETRSSQALAARGTAKRSATSHGIGKVLSPGL